MYTSRNIAERPYSLNINTKLALAVTAILTEKILISETGSSSRDVELDHIQEEIEEVSAVPEVKEKKKSRNALRKGSEGEEVRAMQEASQKLGFYLGEEDMEFSSFSSGTERAVKTWQTWDLIVDTIDTGFSWALVMHMTQDIEGFISNLQKMVTGRLCVLCRQFWMTGVNERLFLLNPWRNE
ncbi:unnamed protein product [Prunus armeniaca]